MLTNARFFIIIINRLLRTSSDTPVNFTLVFVAIDVKSRVVTLTIIIVSIVVQWVWARTSLLIKFIAWVLRTRWYALIWFLDVKIWVWTNALVELVVVSTGRWAHTGLKVLAVFRPSWTRIYTLITMFDVDTIIWAYTFITLLIKNKRCSAITSVSIRIQIRIFLTYVALRDIDYTNLLRARNALAQKTLDSALASRRKRVLNSLNCDNMLWS